MELRPSLRFRYRCVDVIQQNRVVIEAFGRVIHWRLAVAEEEVVPVPLPGFGVFPEIVDELHFPRQTFQPALFADETKKGRAKALDLCTTLDSSIYALELAEREGFEPFAIHCLSHDSTMKEQKRHKT